MLYKIFNELNDTKKTIITIRHTESEHHVTDMTGGVSYWNLTKKGKAEAFAAGKWLSENENLSGFKMYASDLPRTMQTAEEICAALKQKNISPLSPIPEKALREIDLGEGNGIPLDLYNKTISPKPPVYDPNHRSFPHAENDTELFARMKKFYDRLLQSDEKDFILVSHGGTLMFLHLVIMGKTLEDVKNTYSFGKAGCVSKFIIEEDGSCTVKYLNKDVI